MDVVDHESHPIHIAPWSFIAYWSWLLKEIFLSNIQVSKIILNPKLMISPRVIKVQASQKTELGRVIYANSITLTPGTVTLDISDDTLMVHSLMESSAESLKTGEMDNRIGQMEKMP